MAVDTFLVRTMSDTVETDIQRVHVIANEILPRYKHQAMEKAGMGGYFEEIVDRDETYYAKEQGLYYLYRKHRPKHMRILLLSGTATYIKAANNADGCKVGDTYLEVISFALSTEHSYNDEETLCVAQPKALIRSYDELLPQ